jgi:trk system potassium uptake protein TrkH
MSGVTSCGLTLSARPDLLPLSVQWWRSLCEWVGGVGVVVLMLVLIEPAEHHDAFYRAEARSWRLEGSLQKTALRIWTIFTGLSVCSVVGLRLAGAPWWEALNHGMTAIATGGFTVRADSFQGVAPSVQWAAMLFMAMGAFSFRTYHRLLVDRHPPWRQSTQMRWLTALMLAGAAILMGIAHLEKIDATRTHAVFQWVSALGTCGFTAVDLSQWGPAAMLFLIVGMVIGGASGSTTGGIKIARLVWLSKNAVKHLQNRLNDSSDPESYRFNGRTVETQEAVRRIRYAALLAGLWILALICGWIVLLLAIPAAPPVHLLFETASALGSVGLSSGVTRPEMPALAKGCLAFLMWIGRLEIISAVMLFTAPFRGVGRHAKKSAGQD